MDDDDRDPIDVPGPGGPVAEPERILALDVLRGVALLGILVMNIQAFAMVFAAYGNPTYYGPVEGANLWGWLVQHTLFDTKFMTIFTVLFGAGVVLMTERAEAAGLAPRIHFRRMGWLIGFGLVHGFLLWWGDILLTYGIAGIVVYFFRGLAPRTQLLAGFGFVVLTGLIFGSVDASMDEMNAEELAKVKEVFVPTPEQVELEIDAYRGSYLDALPMRAQQTVEILQMFLLMFLWRIIGTMLIGMALFRMGVLAARASTRFYAVTAAVGFSVGVPIVVLGAKQWRDSGFAWEQAFMHMQVNYWGGLAVAAGWIGLTIYVFKTGCCTWLTSRLAAVGRMAFTNYILHTLICTTIFYGHGMGWFASTGRGFQLSLVVAIWVLQLALSPWWLARFRMGPLEWLWRRLTYGTWPLMSRA